MRLKTCPGAVGAAIIVEPFAALVIVAADGGGGTLDVDALRRAPRGVTRCPEPPVGPLELPKVAACDDGLRMLAAVDEARFWQLIGLIDSDQIGEERDDDAALAPLVEALTDEGEDELRAFDDHLSRALFRLDGKAFADQAGESGGSDDGFLYARCWVVAQGRQHYDAVAADPSLMPKDLDQWFEPLLSAAAQAWEEQTGEEWSHDPVVSFETGSNREAWK